MSKRLRIYTEEDVATHTQPGDVWLHHAGKVYDVSSFVNDHPGGDDLVLKYAGQDVGDVMRDADQHEHSEAAYSMLEEYVVGRIGTDESLLDENWEATDDFHPDDTDEVADFEKNEFIDLRKPMLRQVWESNWSKSYYLKQVHQPRHLPEPARIFGPDYLEILSRTVWYIIPIIWLPIASYLLLRSILQFDAPLPAFTSQPLAPLSLISTITTDAVVKSGFCFVIGNIIWTLLEYTMHRFLFHLDDWLPDYPAFLTLHFLLHGIHHYLPMDRLRLVMPPTLFAILQAPFTWLAHQLFTAAVANGIIAGAFAFYVIYDVMHYALHHNRLPKYMREQKKYHLAHHYKNFELGFGITSKIWDVVFNTVLPLDQPAPMYKTKI